MKTSYGIVSDVRLKDEHKNRIRLSAVIYFYFVSKYLCYPRFLIMSSTANLECDTCLFHKHFQSSVYSYCKNNLIKSAGSAIKVFSVALPCRLTYQKYSLYGESLWDGEISKLKFVVMTFCLCPPFSLLKENVLVEKKTFNKFSWFCPFFRHLCREQFLPEDQAKMESIRKRKARIWTMFPGWLFFPVQNSTPKDFG